MKRFLVVFFFCVCAGESIAQTPLDLPTLLRGFEQTVSQNRQSSASVSVTGDAIVAVQVTGNTHLAEGFLLDQAGIAPGEVVTPFRINRAIRALRALSVFSDVTSEVQRTSKGRVLVFRVVENPVIGRVRFVGNRTLNADALERMLKSRAGDLVNVTFVREDMVVLRGAYQDVGIMQAAVQPVFPEKDGDDLVFTISEPVVSEIRVTGNSRTQTYVITREMTTKPGDVLQTSRVREDLRRIFNLGYFTNLEPQFLPAGPDNYVMQIMVEERPTQANFTLGGGFSPLSGFSLFTDLYWDNMFGTGQIGMLKLSLGRSNTYQVKYVNPWMWDVRKSLSVKAWVRDGDVDAFASNSGNVVFRNELSQGIEVGIGWPFSYELTTEHSVKIENVQLRDVNKNYTLHTYRFGVGYDTRDVRFNPTSGEWYTSSIEHAFPFQSQSLEYTKYDVEFRQFFPTFEKQTLAARLAFGFLQSPRLSERELFARELYRMGGGSTVRGWNDYNPFGVGSKMMLGSLEYRFLFSDLFQMVLFVDAGQATNDALSLSDLRMGKGLGFRIQSPLGPIRLDWGIGDEGDSYIHFNIGHTF